MEQLPPGRQGRVRQRCHHRTAHTNLEALYFIAGLAARLPWPAIVVIRNPAGAIQPPVSPASEA
jgi:hypothetical protein